MGSSFSKNLTKVRGESGCKWCAGLKAGENETGTVPYPAWTAAREEQAGNRERAGAQPANRGHLLDRDETRARLEKGGGAPGGEGNAALIQRELQVKSPSREGEELRTNRNP